MRDDDNDDDDDDEDDADDDDDDEILGFAARRIHAYADPDKKNRWGGQEHQFINQASVLYTSLQTAAGL